MWWQRGPIVVVLVDPDAEDWPATIALGAPTVLIRDSEFPSNSRSPTPWPGRRAACVAKADITSGLTSTLNAVAQGLMVMSWDYAGALLKWAPDPAPEMPKLTAREYDILGSIARGHTIRQTARTLGIAAKTVENTQARLFRKLGVRNRMEALTIADALGLIDRAAPQPTRPRPQPDSNCRRYSRSGHRRSGSPAGDSEPALGSRWAR